MVPRIYPDYVDIYTRTAASGPRFRASRTLQLMSTWHPSREVGSLQSTIDDVLDHGEEEAEMSTPLAVRHDSNRGLISGPSELPGIAIDLVPVLRLEPEPSAVSTI
jgi:hypothetical protein